MIIRQHGATNLWCISNSDNDPNREREYAEWLEIQAWLYSTFGPPREGQPDSKLWECYSYNFRTAFVLPGFVWTVVLCGEDAVSAFLLRWA